MSPPCPLSVQSRPSGDSLMPSMKSASESGVTRGQPGHRTFRLVVGLLGIQTLLLAYSAWAHSPTLNEPAHLAAGIRHWQSGQFDLYRVNPPLVRLVAALPALASGVTTDWSRLGRFDGSVRSDFVVGDDFLKVNGERSQQLMTWARWACLPFLWVGGFVCYQWAGALYGTRAGLVAAALWCFSPNLLAHGALITPDAPATALFVLACYRFWRWLRGPDWLKSLAMGLALGFAELTKLTFVYAYFLLPFLWAIDRTLAGGQTMEHWRREAGMVASGLFMSLLVTNIGYGFEGVMKPLGRYRFSSQLLRGSESLMRGNRFESSAIGVIPVPLPANYVLGLDVQRADFENYGRQSYLRGRFQKRGWWYYYLYALAIKVPLGVWGLIGFALAWRRCEAGRNLQGRDELVLLLPAVTLLILVSSQTGFSEHLRYVLPIVPFVAIGVSQVACRGPKSDPKGSGSRHDGAPVDSDARRTRPFQSPKRRRLVGAALLAASVTSSLWTFPHSLAYFNELVGGSRGGHAHLLGSNVDWGQDLRYLKAWLRNHPEATPLCLAYCGRIDPRLSGIQSYNAPQADSKREFPSGWYAISVNLLRGSAWYVPDGHGGTVSYGPGDLTPFLSQPPVAVVGASIHVYRIDHGNSNVPRLPATDRSVQLPAR